jgi:hypothetical protein
MATHSTLSLGVQELCCWEDISKEPKKIMSNAQAAELTGHDDRIQLIRLSTSETDRFKSIVDRVLCGQKCPVISNTKIW